MFERVLTATDMFEACDAAVITALEITKQNQGKLFILHVMEPSYLNECGPLEHVKDFKTGKETAASQEYKEAVKEALNEKCAAALKPYGNYQIDLSYGRPYIEIRRWARKMGADLIVLGPHGGKIEGEGLTGEPLGNTVEGVIMNVTSPVMIINRLIPKEKLNFKKIMVCVDFSKSCAYGFQFATTLAQRYGSKLFLFHVLSAPEKATAASQEKLSKFCKVPEGIGHEYSIWEGTQPYLEILKYAREKDVDLVVMGSRTREGDERGYIGSAVEQVSTECFCPVAVVTHPDTLSKMKS